MSGDGTGPAGRDKSTAFHLAGLAFSLTMARLQALGAAGAGMLASEEAAPLVAGIGQAIRRLEAITGWTLDAEAGDPVPDKAQRQAAMAQADFMAAAQEILDNYESARSRQRARWLQAHQAALARQALARPGKRHAGPPPPVTGS